MKPRNFLKLALPLIAAASIAASAHAQDKKGSNLSDSATLPVATTPAEQLALGYRLADYARTTRDARAMIVAARLVESVTVRPGAEKGKLAGKGAGRAAPAAPVSPAAKENLFAEARQFAAGDPEILGEIERAQAEASRGAGGAIRLTQFVPPETTWTVRHNGRGGEPFMVAIRRDAMTPVDLKLYDENGNLICQDMSHNVTLVCRVTPIWSGPLSAEAINHGKIGTGIAMVTN